MPGWDDFLTEQDKEHQKVRGKKELSGFGENPVVLVIDDYYSVLGLERLPILESIKTWPMSCGLEGWEAIDKTVDLLDSARAEGIPVIYVHGLENFPAPWSGRKNAGKSYLDKLPEEMRRKANQIVEEIAPQPGELVIQKSAASAFQGTPLQFHLNYEGVDTIIACGETTSGCVRASVVDGATYRYRMGVVEECCFDRTQASHWINLFDMHQKYADVIDRFQAAAYFESVSEREKLPVEVTV
jgi:nicotinamidase-related amidase